MNIGLTFFVWLKSQTFCFLKKFHDTSVDTWESLISDHHLSFKSLYPASITLKYIIGSLATPHFKVRPYKCFPIFKNYIYRYVPLVHFQTTRFEAKHKLFKHLCNVTGNFTNICYSLVLRYQLHQCYLSLNSKWDTWRLAQVMNIKLTQSSY